MVTSYVCPELGQILRDRGSNCVCELGVCEKKGHKLCSPGLCNKKKAVLWEDIDKVYVSATKTYVYFVPASESIELNVVSTDGNTLSLGVSSAFRVGEEQKQLMWDVYGYVVSKVFDRQWKKLISDLEQGYTISFNSFDVTFESLRKSKMFGQEVIELSNIVDWQLYNAQLQIRFRDKKSRLKWTTLGGVGYIPNIHLAEAFLKYVIKDNQRVSQ
jgi:hypothetical protein